MRGQVPNYIRDIPPPGADPFPEHRDGVCRDDDLALRALKPEFRPKRGRRRADEAGDDMMEPMSALEPKRPHLDTSVVAGSSSGAFATPSTAYPHSAYPGVTGGHDDYDGGPGSKSQWLQTPAPTPNTASSQRPPSAGNAFRFHQHLSANPDNTPTTPHPLSSVPMTPTPMSAHPDSAYPHSTTDEHPHGSASPAYLTQSQKMRMRRRHGTAVSSAWPGNNTTPNGKLRGRPPSNRTVKDGQFISFPANPAGSSRKEGPVVDLASARATPTSGAPPLTIPQQPQSGTAAEQTPIQSASTASPAVDSPFSMRGSGPQIPTPVSASSQNGGKPGRMSLSLQVPQHVGNPVHLVTPTVMINGAPTPSTASSSREGGQPSHPPGFLHPSGGAPTSAPANTQFGGGLVGIQGISTETLHRALAADLVRASVTGRRNRRISADAAIDKGKATSKPAKRPKTGKSSVSASVQPSGLRGTEARDLAGVMLRDLRAGYGLPPLQAYAGRGSTPGGSEASPTSGFALQTPSQDSPAEVSFRQFCAAWLGIPLPSSTTPNSRTEKRIIVRRFRVNDDGYESPVGDDEDEAEAEEEDDHARSKKHAAGKKRKIKETFDVEWDLGAGHMIGRFSMKGLNLEGSADNMSELDGEEYEDISMADAEDEEDDNDEAWERRYHKLEAMLKKRSEELRVLKEAVLDVALKT
jgi:ARS binding protein 2